MQTNKKLFATKVLAFNGSNEDKSDIIDLIEKSNIRNMEIALEVLIDHSPDGKILTKAVHFLEQTFAANLKQRQITAMATVIIIDNITVKLPEHTGRHKSLYLSFYEGKYSPDRTAALSYDKGSWHVQRVNNVTPKAAAKVLAWALKNTDALKEIWIEISKGSGRVPSGAEVAKRQREIEKTKKEAKSACPEIFTYNLISVKTHPSHTITLKIDEPCKLEKTVDMKPLIAKKKILAPLLDAKTFLKVHNLGDHVDWPLADIMLSVMDLLDLPEVTKPQT